MGTGNLVFLRDKMEISYFEFTWKSLNDGAQHFGELSIANMNSLC